MLTATRGAEALGPVSSAPARARHSFSNAPTFSNTPSTTDSFAQQLAASLEGYLSNTPVGSQLEIKISPQTSQDSGTRQFVVTVKTTPDSPTPKLPTSSTTSSPAAVLGGSSVASASAPAPTVYTDEADAYWGMQPKEVQVLRTIQDEGERYETARVLAQEGFLIDTHIMVNWLDPYMTMKVRKEEGYTWFPALGQGTVMNRPGFNFAGMAPYDPFNPPPGSIKVSTDFALGLEHTSPGGRPANHGRTS